MLAGERLKKLQELVSTSTKEELIWINGYLSGLVSNGNGNGHAIERELSSGGAVALQSQAPATAVKKITLVFGTETGNSKRVATQLAGIAKKSGVITKLAGLDQYRLTDLEKEAAGLKKSAGRKFYDGKISTNINLNDRGSNKETYHIEITTAENVEYEAGDAIAIIPVNKKIIVDHIIKSTGIDRNLLVETAKVKATVEDLLTNHLNICYLLSSTIKKYAAIVQQEIPDVRMDLVDLLRIYPTKSAEQFVEVLQLLSAIAPRLYSISSSPAAHGMQEIHLTVSRHSFRVKEEQRFGLCSDFLGELPAGTAINFYIHKNRGFRLPAPEKDVIMIGPGTGIAPFRSFLAERDASGANGKNWFFFGEQHFVSDFLYQLELQNFLSTGVLTKLSLAFSRDQAEKIYVQHRMQEQAAELYQWIDNGAYVYLSGTRDPMSKDVEHSLIKIFEEQGGKTYEEAKKYLQYLKDAGRYEKDVY